MIACRECGKPLTDEEALYYGDRCEQCERDWFDRIEAWLAGGDDTELDAMYSAPQPAAH